MADRKARIVLAATDANGDLLIARPGTDARADAMVVRRSEFRNLAVWHAALDDAGDAYVCTVAGGREKADQRITLCRQSESNATRCVVLALETPDDFEHRIDALVVPEPGVVVLRAGGELSRFELPE